MKHLTKDLTFLNEKFEDLCTDCNGLGHIADKECPSCDATGYKVYSKSKKEELHENTYSRYHYDRNNQDYETCNECDGMGHIHETECHACEATGLVHKNTSQAKKTQSRFSKPQPYHINGQDFTLCLECEGQGHIGDRECYSCGATGLKPRTAMKYDLDHYTELYQKYISFDKNPAYRPDRRTKPASKEKQI